LIITDPEPGSAEEHPAMFGIQGAGYFSASYDVDKKAFFSIKIRKGSGIKYYLCQSGLKNIK